jgi:hypothetical protein
MVLAGAQPGENLVAGHLADTYGVPFALGLSRRAHPRVRVAPEVSGEPRGPAAIG